MEIKENKKKVKVKKPLLATAKISFYFVVDNSSRISFCCAAGEKQPQLKVEIVKKMIVVFTFSPAQVPQNVNLPLICEQVTSRQKRTSVGLLSIFLSFPSHSTLEIHLFPTSQQSRKGFKKKTNKQRTRQRNEKRVFGDINLTHFE